MLSYVNVTYLIIGAFVVLIFALLRAQSYTTRVFLFLALIVLSVLTLFGGGMQYLLTMFH